MYLGNYRGEYNIPIVANTHDPNTGAVADADANPTYEIYSSDMQLVASGELLPTGSTGMYMANYSPGELDYGSYVIRITATVSGVSGALLHTFEHRDKPAEIWQHSSRTLTVSANTIYRPQEQSRLRIHSGDTFLVEISGLGNLVSYDQIDFTVKSKREDEDSLAVIRVRYGEPSGLLRLMGEETEYDGRIEIANADLGNLVIHLSAQATRQLVPAKSLHYDIQGISIDGVTTICEGYLDVIDDVTKAVE